MVNHHELVKKTVIMIVMLLLTSVWSNVCAGLQEKQPSVVIPPMDIPLCSPAIVPIGKYLFVFPATDTLVKLPLEYFDMLQCTSQQTNLLLLPSSVASEPTRDTICAGESYTWNGKTYTKPGSYTDTLQNIYGCDSIVTLHLQVNPTYEVHDTVVACDSYDWHGQTYTESGNYTYTTTAANGCDSITTLHLTINNSEVGTTEYVTICHGETYTWNGNTYDTSDTYTITLTNQQDCDSTATLVLTILPAAVTATENITIGSDQLPYLWRGQSLNATGQYTDIEQYVAAACDSAIHVLNLTVLATGATEEQTVTICDTELPYHWYEQDYSTTGIYTYIEKYAGTNIDSIQHILHLTVNYRDTAFFTQTACDSYEWHGEEYKASGTYYYNTQTVLGCDSVEVMRLTILPPTKHLAFDTLLCHGVTCEWRNMLLTTAGTYNDTVKNQLDCDSIIYMLNLEYLPDVQHFATDTFLCYGEVCDWRGITYHESGTYHDTIRNVLSCDSLIYTLQLQIYPEIPITHVVDTMAGAEYHWNNEIYTYGGDYTVTLPAITGCDSVVILHLTNNHAAIDTVIVAEQCAGSGEQEVQIVTQGFIDEIALRFSPEAHAVGWRDTVMPISQDGTYTISHDSIRAGIYAVEAVARFHQQDVAKYDFSMYLLYPNTIFDQRYNDLIAIMTAPYNGGYDFIAFQWYKNGAPILGETHSYLNQSLSFGAEYSALLTSADGVQLMSCPFRVKNQADISVFPTVVQDGSPITCLLQQPMQLTVYHSSGIVHQERYLPIGTHHINLPTLAGIYLLVFKSDDHVGYNVKVIVQ